jgi:hypothetical protein
MHAVAVEMTLKDGNKARQALSQQVVPGVRRLPGVQGGSWFEPKPGRGPSFALFDSEQNAKDGAVTVGECVPEFVEVTSVDVRGVIEQA